MKPTQDIGKKTGDTVEELQAISEALKLVLEGEDVQQIDEVLKKLVDQS